MRSLEGHGKKYKGSLKEKRGRGAAEGKSKGSHHMRAMRHRSSGIMGNIQYLNLNCHDDSTFGDPLREYKTSLSRSCTETRFTDGHLVGVYVCVGGGWGGGGALGSTTHADSSSIKSTADCPPDGYRP